MAVAFSDAERAAARAAIRDEARRLFVRGGLTAVSLARVTDAAGIAKTSFYSFFACKEELILDLLAEEGPGVSARVMTPLTDSALAADEALARFLRALLSEYATNPFLARLTAEPETLAALASRVRPADLELKAAWMQRPLAAFFEERMRSGEIVNRPVQAHIDVVQAVALLSLHRERFGTAERFTEAAEEVIRRIANGLYERGD